MSIMISHPRIAFFIACFAALALGGAVFAQGDSTSDESETAATGDVPQINAKAPAKTATPKLITSKPAAAKPVKEAQAVPALRPTATAQQLPNGASSINESYGSWTVSCRLNDGQKLCTLAQIQGNKQTGQRTFGIELLTPKSGKIDGTVVMPFGLKLDAGASLKLDDKDFGQTLHFSTCIPDGCLLPVSFPTTAIEALQKGTALSVNSIGLGNGQPVTFSISLDGFAAALKRVTELGS
jgi:invasion protein IalB